MIDIKEIVKKMTTKFSYKVKVKQSYDDLTFEFSSIDEAATFAQTCLENIMDTHKDSDETQVTITCDKVEMKLEKNNVNKQEDKTVKEPEAETEAEPESEPVEVDTEEKEEAQS